MIYFKSCLRCEGDVYHEVDGWGFYEVPAVRKDLGLTPARRTPVSRNGNGRVRLDRKASKLTPPVPIVSSQ